MRVHPPLRTGDTYQDGALRRLAAERTGGETSLHAVELQIRPTS